jgi:murein L,D-transpeptidase YcbB/YkuD
MVRRKSFWSGALLCCCLAALLIGLFIPAFACSVAAADATNRDALLTERARLVGLVEAGDVPTFEYVRPLSIGSRGHDVEAARTVLAVRGYPSSPVNGERTFFDTGMAGAVEGFQRDNRLNADGILGPATAGLLSLDTRTLIEHIDQALPLPDTSPAGWAIVINVAAAELKILHEGRTILESRVIVGRPSRKTPTFTAEIEAVTFNPSWHVPPHIVRQDILPEMAKDREYAERRQIDVYARENGTWIRTDPDAIDWRNRPAGYRFVQRPHAGNALGRVKFEMANRFGVYLHDTPDRHLFARDRRTYSSGCIRIDQALDAARLLLGDAAWSSNRIAEWLSSGRTFRVNLPEPVSVRIEYRLADVTPDGVVRALPDVYKVLPGRSPSSSGENVIVSSVPTNTSAYSYCAT